MNVSIFKCPLIKHDDPYNFENSAFVVNLKSQ